MVVVIRCWINLKTLKPRLLKVMKDKPCRMFGSINVAATDCIHTYLMFELLYIKETLCCLTFILNVCKLFVGNQLCILQINVGDMHSRVCICKVCIIIIHIFVIKYMYVCPYSLIKNFAMSFFVFWMFYNWKLGHNILNRQVFDEKWRFGKVSLQSWVSYSRCLLVCIQALELNSRRQFPDWVKW